MAELSFQLVRLLAVAFLGWLFVIDHYRLFLYVHAHLILADEFEQDFHYSVQARQEDFAPDELEFGLAVLHYVVPTS